MGFCFVLFFTQAHYWNRLDLMVKYLNNLNLTYLIKSYKDLCLILFLQVRNTFIYFLHINWIFPWKIPYSHVPGSAQPFNSLYFNVCFFQTLTNLIPNKHMAFLPSDNSVFLYSSLPIKHLPISCVTNIPKCPFKRHNF